MPPHPGASGYHLTRERLMQDLYRSYLEARRHKRGKPYQMKFEMHLEDNLSELCDELWERTYAPLPSKCFVIKDPTLREVFAADFRDRVVHHLYYKYTYKMYDQTLIEDCYSCRKGKGTLYGVERLAHHIKVESHNYTRDCYVLKMDVSGYFMHINRVRLLGLCLQTQEKMAHRQSCIPGRSWREAIDMDFVDYLTRQIVLLNPTAYCHIYGSRKDWAHLPRSKSLYYSDEGCGLPIGNLTSQVFSNIYMNVFDQWMKRQLKCGHYGRYVDDFYVVSTSRQWLTDIVDRITDFLWTELGLTVNPEKTIIYNVKYGVPFLGCYLKMGRTYVERKSWRHMRQHLLHEQEYAGVLRLRSVVNSYLGLLRHVNSYQVTQQFFCTLKRVQFLGSFAPYKRKFELSAYTLDTMRIQGYLRMIDEEECPLEYADVEVLCHEYVDKYLATKE